MIVFVCGNKYESLTTDMRGRRASPEDSKFIHITVQWYIDREKYRLIDLLSYAFSTLFVAISPTIQNILDWFVSAATSPIVPQPTIGSQNISPHSNNVSDNKP